MIRTHPGDVEPRQLQCLHTLAAAATYAAWPCSMEGSELDSEGPVEDMMPLVLL